MRSRPARGLCLSVCLSVCLSIVTSEPARGEGALEPPRLPGPALDVPVDTDGDGLSSFGDRWFFNWWLSQGGSLEKALLSAQVSDGVVGLGAFFSSREAALSPAAPISFGGSAEPAAAGGGSHSSHIDFTRRIPPDIVPNEVSRQPRATPDGAFFVFSSAADLGFGSNGKFQVYRVAVNARDVSTILLVSVDTSGNMAAQNCDSPSVSDDGLVIAFHTTAQLDPVLDQNNHQDVYVRDLRGAQPVTRLVSASAATGDAGDALSRYPSVSGDGTVVAFTSKASDLLKGDPGTGGIDNVYRVGSDGVSPAMERVSVDDFGNPCTGFGGDCRSFDLSLQSAGKVLNADGKLIVFQGAPQNPNGGFSLIQSLPCNSSPFANLQVFLRDLRDAGNPRTFVASARWINQQTISCGNGSSRRPSISTDGSRIVFSSLADNLVSQDNNSAEDIFFVNVAEVVLTIPVPVRASVSWNGTQANGASRLPMITPDGQHIVFTSLATNLDPDTDSNAQQDIFVRHLEASTTRRMNMDCTDEQANGLSTNPDIFLDGWGVVYESLATNLLDCNQDAPGQACTSPTDQNGKRDVFESRLKPRFVRGDVDLNGTINLTDAQRIFNWLFSGGPRPECLDAADVDDNSMIQGTDGQRILDFLFDGGPPPECPFGTIGGTTTVDPAAADFDPTDDCQSCKRRPAYASPDHDHGGQTGCP
jgi:Tol biopolymer transport system component